jgi:hypothetical protein
MENKDLYKWDFEREMKDLAVSCKGLKPDTAKRKAAALFKKYDYIIQNHGSDVGHYERRYWEEVKKFNTLKSGLIHYMKGETKGTLLLKELVWIELRKNDVLVVTKTGKEIALSNDFQYLRELL